MALKKKKLITANKTKINTRIQKRVKVPPSLKFCGHLFIFHFTHNQNQVSNDPQKDKYY